MRDESREHESLAGNLRGKVVFSSDDENLGLVEDLLYRRISDVPEWFIVRHEGRNVQAVLFNQPVTAIPTNGYGASLRRSYSVQKLLAGLAYVFDQGRQVLNSGLLVTFPHTLGEGEEQ
jgi:hypothetical protein